MGLVTRKNRRGMGRRENGDGEGKMSGRRRTTSYIRN